MSYLVVDKSFTLCCLPKCLSGSQIAKKKTEEKKKSNLELFKEELKQYVFTTPIINHFVSWFIKPTSGKNDSVLLEYRRNVRKGTKERKMSLEEDMETWTYPYHDDQVKTNLSLVVEFLFQN